ncbi:Bromo domain-containing protein [Citrus sinensis]|uniref:Bromo domain-containing protein n=1 Tax=Citrus sinensis TaxID=2711 RepID=A0ACB8P048_CITSI|nr:Bromo domain-containing protein [Citrus sinensis]
MLAISSRAALSDVFLICTNAMQYNAPDTVYHKQARAIQELAKKKFHRLRAGIERSEKELKPEKELNLEKELRLEKDLKSEPKTKSSILVKKQTKKHFSRTIQEPVGSDFSSGATLATTGDIQNGSVATQAGGCERPTNTDAIVDGNSSLADNNLEKVEELSSAKGLLSKLGRKPAVPDENRRATYSISTQPVVRSDSIFTTFEGETKHLVAVGLHAEYSYARSLARFAATLGPVAWKVASRRIEQALPAGCKFGRGWVGEYEPLPTPVLMLETCTQKESALFSKLQSTADVRKDDTAFRIPVPAKVHPVHRPISEGNSPLFRPANGLTPEGKTPHFSSAGKKPSTPVNAIKQKHNPFSRTSAEPENKVSKQVELNLPPSANQSKGDTVAGKQVSVKLETGVSRSTEMVPRNMNLLQSSPSKQQNGNVTSNSGNARVISPSTNNVPSQMAGAATFFPHGPEQGRSDSVHLMKTLNEKAQKQQNSSNQSAINTPPVMPSVPSVRRDDSGNAAAVAARAWMSIGAGGFKPPAENSTSPKNQISAESLYNPTREFHTQISRARGEFPLSVGMQFQTEKNSFPPQGLMPQPVRAVNEAHFQNRPMVFPQLLTNDFARFQMQSPWRGLSPHSQPRPRQEGLPPDLNISFQSPGSPVKQSTGVLVDSQQPDLALQL